MGSINCSDMTFTGATMKPKFSSQATARQSEPSILKGKEGKKNEVYGIESGVARGKDALSRVADGNRAKAMLSELDKECCESTKLNTKSQYYAYFSAGLGLLGYASKEVSSFFQANLMSNIASNLSDCKDTANDMLKLIANLTEEVVNHAADEKANCTAVALSDSNSVIFQKEVIIPYGVYMALMGGAAALALMKIQNQGVADLKNPNTAKQMEVFFSGMEGVMRRNDYTYVELNEDAKERAEDMDKAVKQSLERQGIKGTPENIKLFHDELEKKASAEREAIETEKKRAGSNAPSQESGLNASRKLSYGSTQVDSKAGAPSSANSHDVVSVVPVSSSESLAEAGEIDREPAAIDKDTAKSRVEYFQSEVERLEKLHDEGLASGSLTAEEVKELSELVHIKKGELKEWEDIFKSCV